MQELWGKIATWVEAHALPVGIGGLVMLLIGGGVGVAGLASGGGSTDDSTPAETTVATVPPVITETTNPDDGDGATETTEASDDTASRRHTPDEPGVCPHCGRPLRYVGRLPRVPTHERHGIEQRGPPPPTGGVS